MIDKETTSRLLVEMIVQGAPDTELALVIEYSKLILDADIMYKKQIHQIVNKYATDSKEEK